MYVDSVLLGTIIAGGAETFGNLLRTSGNPTKISVNVHPDKIDNAVLIRLAELKTPMIRTSLAKSVFDTVYNGCQRNRIGILGLMSEWAFTGGDAPPFNKYTEWTMDDLKPALEYFINRYPQIIFYEVFNEQDNEAFRTGDIRRAGDKWADKWVEVIKECSKILHSYGKKVVAPTLAWMGMDNYLTMDVVNDVDIVAMHPYGKDWGFWLDWVKKIRARFGKPIWATEFGTEMHHDVYVVEYCTGLGLQFQQNFYYELSDEGFDLYGLINVAGRTKSTFYLVKGINR